MSSIFSGHLAAGLDSVTRLAGEAVTYHDGHGSVELLAVEGRSRYEVETEPGVVVTATVTDFTLRAAELVIGGQAVAPRTGHWIGKHGRRYIVTPLGTEECSRPMHAGRTHLRIHTREVE